MAGVIDNLAENEEDAFRMIRQFLSYMPDNVWKLPPRVEPDDDPNRREEALLSLIPRDRREIEAAPDPKAKQEEIERRLKAIASPFRTAEAFNIEDIIDPRETRPMLCDFIETAQDMLKTQLGPSDVPYMP